MSKFYVTTPIYYVNDKPHIGHAYTTILADVLARYHRMMGTPTFFLTGTDEHGLKVKQAAEKAGMSPQAQADSTVVRFQELWKKLEITNDDFIRTTEPRHKIVVQKILQDLWDRKEIYRAEYDGWYCVACERFFMEKDLVDGVCPEPSCGRPVEKVREANYFFKMSKYQEWLVDYIQKNPTFIQPDFRKNETLGFLRKPLQDLCISRPKNRLNWGIDLPFDKDFVTYVWFDALVNYISAAGYLSDDVKFKKWWPVSCQLIGKDILTTHTVYWPTMLKAMGVAMPEMIFAHGWWLSGRDKMSKTAGNVVNPLEFSERFGVDAFRYFLMSEMSLGMDASFTEEAFTRRYNADLANDLGNLLNRVVKIIHTDFEGKVPAPGAYGEEEKKLQDLTLAAVEKLIESINTMKPDDGITGVVGLIRETNRYLEVRQPWTLSKKKELEALATVLYTGAEVLRIVGGALAPVMPGKMAELLGVLGLGKTEQPLAGLRRWGELKPGTAVGELVSLFPRLSSKPVAAVAEKPAASAAAKTGEPAAIPGVLEIEYADFSKIKLCVGKILEAVKVEGADKLLKLQVDLGAEKRQIVAGIAMYYKPEELPGKSIIVVANLKPALIRKVESRGMLLAASSGGSLRVITVDGDMPPGSVVK